MKRPYRQCDPPPTGATKNEPNPQIRKTQPRALFALTRVHSRPIIHPHPGKRPSGKPFPYNGTLLTPTPATFYKTKTQQAPCHPRLHFSPERQILRRILFLKRSRQWEPALGLIREALKNKLAAAVVPNTRKHVSGWVTRGMEPVKQAKLPGSSENGELRPRFRQLQNSKGTQPNPEVYPALHLFALAGR